MTRSRLALCAATALAFTPFACASGGLPAPTELDRARVTARWPDVKTADLEQGRSLYAERCARCHELYAPADFPAPEWESAVVEMRERARLSPGEERAIVQYLVSVSSRSAAHAQHTGKTRLE